jgi:thiazolylpeptide-type bacteriocin precursor
MNTTPELKATGDADAKGDLVSLAAELQALESETFEIRDYVELDDMSLAISSTSTSSCSTSSTCSTTSCCA